MISRGAAVGTCKGAIWPEGGMAKARVAVASAASEQILAVIEAQRQLEVVKLSRWIGIANIKCEVPR